MSQSSSKKEDARLSLCKLQMASSKSIHIFVLTKLQRRIGSLKDAKDCVRKCLFECREQKLKIWTTTHMCPIKIHNIKAAGGVQRIRKGWKGKKEKQWLIISDLVKK